MTRRPSLQVRLGLGLTAGIMLTWLVATVVAGLVVRHELDEAFDSALQETAQRLLALAVTDIVSREEDMAVARRVAAFGAHDEFLTYLVRDGSGAVLLRSHDADPDHFPPVPVAGFHDTATHRLYGEAAVSGTIVIEVAEPLSHRREATLEAVGGLLVVLPVLLPVSLVGVWWFVRRIMRPVLELGAEIERRDGGDLSPMPAMALPAEIGPIADAVDRLFDRLRRALDAQRSFTANSAHELRTPIAAALAQTQRLVAEAPEGGLRERAQRIEAALHRLARLSEKLMQLARAEGAGLIAAEPGDLAVVLVQLVEELRSGPGGDRITLAMPHDLTLPSRIDPDAFAVLLRNLVENAMKHGAAGGPVSVIAADGCIRVVNAGAPLPAVTLARVGGRFVRGDSDAPGSGLGLAIAGTIAAGTGARLDLFSPARGRDDGFEAVLRLPEVSTDVEGVPA